MNIERCGCVAEPTRVCDVCRSPTHAFLACSRGCLRAHQLAAHGPSVPEETERRIRQGTREMNRIAPDAWDSYAPHRQILMDAVSKASGDLCVLGAGNCADIDLEYLTKRFNQVHLVDLDGAALERSRARQTRAVRERIVLHPDLDLSGFLERLDAGGENFPSGAQLGDSIVAASDRLLGQLGRTFDVTLSTCVLSQLVQPFHESWVMSEFIFNNVLVATTALHLATLVGATRPGGSGFMAFDVLSSDDFPKLLELRGRPAEELQAVVQRAVDQEEIGLNPYPDDLLQQVRSSGLGSHLSSARLTPPWLWNIRAGHQLVYGLAFERKS
jgi:hypothetical protein